MKRKILRKSFFRRPTLKVANDLLGKFLVRRISPFEKEFFQTSPLYKGGSRGVKELAAMITEVEAYDGPGDKASHASRGLTERNAVMFGAGGYFYVYLCYGMYEMLNVVTGEKDYPAAVLIRAVEIIPPLQGGIKGGLSLVGPGKLTKFLKIDRRFNKKPISPSTGLWLEDRGLKIDSKKIKRTPRIGVAYAGPIWSKKPYRFSIDKKP